jgi:phage gpG-like protein
VADDVAIRVDGLRELHAALRNTDREAAKALRAELKAVAASVATEAASLAPRRTGRLAASIRPYATGNRAGVRSSLPYAGVVHWGGTIRPKGTPITFPARPFIADAMDRKADEAATQIAAVLDGAIRRAGWH